MANSRDSLFVEVTVARPTVLLAALLVVARPARPAEPAGDEPPALEYRLARAATAAADGALRLHETAEARRWLTEVP
ncbi:hypothetical protein FBQ97_03520, partial [Acidobacteria bacterium ACD]|nr:hypothetical protein [Acidobacteria bacterium ACD]